jgi:hypothetical protein
MKVSWQVTGIRKDAWANTYRIPVEVEKPARERGYYLNPELYDESAEKGIEGSVAKTRALPFVCLSD